MSGGNYAELNFVKRESNASNVPVVGGYLRLDATPGTGKLQLVSDTTESGGMELLAGTDHIWLQPPGGGGNVMIGSYDNPASTLHVKRDVSNTYVARIENQGNDASAFGLKIRTESTNGACPILQCESPAGLVFRAFADGDLFGTGGIITSSDISLKTDIDYMTSSLAKILSLKPITFKWKEHLKLNPRMNRGFIAQDLIEIYPDLVTERDDILSVNYTGLISELVMSTKEQHAIIEEKQTKIEELEARLKAIEDKLGI